MPHNGHTRNKSSFFSLKVQENVIIISQLTESCLGEDMCSMKRCARKLGLAVGIS